MLWSHASLFLSLSSKAKRHINTISIIPTGFIVSYLDVMITKTFELFPGFALNAMSLN